MIYNGKVLKLHQPAEQGPFLLCSRLVFKQVISPTNLVGVCYKNEMFPVLLTAF